MKNEWTGSEMSLVVFESGRRSWVKPITVVRSNRPDLERIPNTYNIEFDFDSERFYKGASTCSIQLRISHDLQEYPICVTPQLMLQALNSNIGIKSGIAFGRVSSDGAAVIGAGGNIFLKGGSNNVEGMYLDEFNIDTEGWVELLNRRKKTSNALDVSFIQMFIPEKSSVNYWNVPFKATKGSPAFNKLLQQIKQDELLPAITLSHLEYLPDEIHCESIFRSFDTHLSTYGAKLIVDKFFEKFFFKGLLYRTGEVCFGEAHGDIGSRFLDDGQVIEKPPLYSSLYDVSGNLLEPSLIYSYDSPKGNIGLQRAWKCSDAPIQKRVLCFGGSSFERGQVSSTLSWWFSRLFKEFHFCWSPEYLPNLVNQVRPDLVVCQSIERFLNVLPSE
ncbi:hypothetical protein [Pseudomonas alabamensis]|uniref:hypothetical protein n=1 Tax=Pseudomonas alabamensis TaxID=3064349 RepID=UPI0012D9582C